MLQKNKFYRYLPSALSGALLIFCFPTFDIYPLAWFALAPFLISLFDKKPKEAFFCGMIMGVLYFFGNTYWIYNSINNYGHIPFILSLLLVLGLSLYLSLYTGLFALLFSMKMKSTKLPAMLIAPVLWVSLEFVRSYALTGFPWASIGYSQYRFLYAIQFADITGIYGVSFLVLVVNSAFADFFISRKRHEEMPLFPTRPIVVAYTVLGCLVLFTLSYSYWRLNQDRQGNHMKVSVIQGNIEQDKKWDAGYRDTVMKTYMELSNQAVASAADLIVWPETSLPFYFGDDELLTNEFISFQKELNAYLLFGAVLTKEPASANKPATLTNSAVLLDKNGKTPYIYDKIHLVPFGEYVPLRGLLFFVDKLVAGIGDFVPGDRITKAYTPHGSFGTFICYEIIFPGLVRKFYSRDGDFIVTITNDAWFGKTAGPYQHFSMGVFRSIENRKPLIRAANTGVSGFIDSNGRIVKTTPVFERAVETMDINTDSTRTIYSRYGDIFSYICIVIAILLLI